MKISFTFFGEMFFGVIFIALFLSYNHAAEAAYVCNEVVMSNSAGIIEKGPVLDYDSEGWLNIHVTYVPGNHLFDTVQMGVYEKDSCKKIVNKSRQIATQRVDSVRRLVLKAESNGSGGFKFRAYNEDTGAPDIALNGAEGDETFAILPIASHTNSSVAVDFSLGYYQFVWSPELNKSIYIFRGFKTGVWQVREERPPLLVIPGIAATELYSSTDLLWLDAIRLLFSNNDEFLNELGYDELGHPLNSYVYPGEILSNIQDQFDYSEAFIENLTQDVGYRVDHNLFTFPYDWRKDLRDVALNELATKIDQLIPDNSGKKLDVVAHSQGGLLIKYLLYSRPEYREKVGKLVFLGTPHLGAPKAGKVLLYGDDMGISLLTLGLDPSEIKKISKNMPSIYQLLPTQSYFSRADGYLGSIERVFLGRDEVINYDYAKSREYLESQGLNPSLLSEAESLHSTAFDNFNLQGSGVDTYNLVGCQEASIGKIFYRKNRDVKIEYLPGDGTVPVLSANNFNANKTYYVTKTDHGKMLTLDATRKQIINILRGFPDALNEDVTLDSSVCRFKGKAVSVHSPVDLQIYNNLGQHVGRNEDGSFDNEIDGVRVDFFGEEKFAFLPDGYEYRIELPATGVGEFDLFVEDLEDSEVNSTTYYSQIPVNESSHAKFYLDGTGNKVLDLDFDGDGEFESQVEPSSFILGGSQNDLLPPVSEVAFSGVGNKVGWFRSSVTANISALDTVQDGLEQAGLLKTKYRVNREEWKDYVQGEELVFEDEGKYVLEIYSLDKAGNVEDVSEHSFYVDKVAPELKLSLDPSILELTVAGLDNLDENPVIENLPGRILVMDAAGNETSMNFLESDFKTSKSATFSGISYNGAEQGSSQASLKFFWKEDKENNLKILTQQLKSKAGLEALVVATPGGTRYVSKNSGTASEQQLQGLWVVVVRTSEGDFVWDIEQAVP